MQFLSLRQHPTKRTRPQTSYPVTSSAVWVFFKCTPDKLIIGSQGQMGERNIRHTTQQFSSSTTDPIYAHFR